MLPYSNLLHSTAISMSVKYIEILRSTLCKLKKKTACLMLSLQIFGMYLRSFGLIILSVFAMLRSRKVITVGEIERYWGNFK